MSYRYPFTPFPKGWYRINELNNKLVFAFGKEWFVDESQRLRLVSNPLCTYPVIHQNGYLFAYYDEKSETPRFEIPHIPEFNHEQWQKPFRLDWRVRIHTQEVVENALDMAHFCTVHTYKVVPHISQFVMNGQLFNVTMHSKKNIFGWVADTTMDITYHGMGIVVAHVLSSSGIELKVFLTTTPIDEEHVELQMDVAIKKTKSKLLDIIFKYLIPPHVNKEFSRDIPVWEAKVYRNRPILCNAEGNIIRIRKWASQFYA